MSRWPNFRIWRGRLPHWRADDVTYYVTFRHRRSLASLERHTLFAQLLRLEGTKWELQLLSVRGTETEMLLTIENGPKGEPYELSDLVEKAKTKAGKKIIAKSGERFPPFYSESYDRIVRDDAELEERWHAVLDAHLEFAEADGADDADSTLWAPETMSRRPEI